jgi:PKHD-type hydroxylase
MIVCIPEVLTPKELGEIRAKALSLPFVDGKETAGARARLVKRNEQVSKSAEERKEIQSQIIAALRRSKEFDRCVLPKNIRPPLISRYRPGMTYGKHVDDALMGPVGARDRSDVSVTLFLSDVGDYEGGELVIHSPFGMQEVKLPAGSAVAYPSWTLHEVTEVTSGERLVAVTWVQSYVRDDSRREILGDLAAIRDHLAKLDPGGQETDAAFRAHTNLLRMWAET